MSCFANPPYLLHVHVRSGKGEAKFWLKPEIMLAESHGFDARTLKELAQAAEQNIELIERTWNDYFA
jgi:hypothetical protein